MFLMQRFRFLGTDTDAFAGFRACKCLQGFYRTHLFEGSQPCDKAGLKCVEDYVTLENGYWWKWKNGTHKLSYEHFTKNHLSLSSNVDEHLDASLPSHSSLEYPYTLPKPHQCPRKNSCLGGLNSPCEAGYQGPLCEVCDAGYYKQLQTCKLCPTKKWMIVQLSVLVTVIVIVIVIVVWTSRKKSRKRKGRSLADIIFGKLKIVIGFYQVTFGVLEAFSYIEWPDSLALIGKYSEMLQLSVFQIAPIHCLFPNLKISAFGSLFAILIMNAAAIVVALAL